MAGNFHGRTTTIISFSDDPAARDGFGPFTPGFVTVPYGDAAALAAAIDDDTVAVLLEPIQGEAGVLVPPDGFLREVRATVHRAQRPDDRRRDPVRPRPHRRRRSPATTRASCPTCTSWARRSAAGSCRCRRSSARADVMGVFRPGEHGSTFGGNPLACAVGHRGRADARDRRAPGAGPRARRRPAGRPRRRCRHDRVSAVRVARPVGRHRHRRRGPGATSARGCCARGVLAKDTHGSTIRLAPPIVIGRARPRVGGRAARGGAAGVAGAGPTPASPGGSNRAPRATIVRPRAEMSGSRARLDPITPVPTRPRADRRTAPFDRPASGGRSSPWPDESLLTPTGNPGGSGLMNGARHLPPRPDRSLLDHARPRPPPPRRPHPREPARDARRASGPARAAPVRVPRRRDLGARGERAARARRRRVPGRSQVAGDGLARQGPGRDPRQRRGGGAAEPQGPDADDEPAPPRDRRGGARGGGGRGGRDRVLHRRGARGLGRGDAPRDARAPRRRSGARCASSRRPSATSRARPRRRSTA